MTNAVHTQDVVPAVGSPVAPYLVVDDGDRAIDFYRRAFGAVEVFRMMDEDGERVAHASLMINGGLVMLSDFFPEWAETTGGERPPVALGGTPVCIHLSVTDADAAWERALAAGGDPVMPIADMFWGDRYGKLRDPFGHIWSVGSPLPER